jgi:DNA (cytosine-5)-methyltransferase 1
VVSSTRTKKAPVELPEYAQKGTETQWYKGWTLTEAEREVFRQRSRASQLARINADKGGNSDPLQSLYLPRLDPSDLMPQLERNGLTALSLFSGGGGLDLGFDRAGYGHIASFDILPFAGATLLRNRPHWNVHSGENGDVVRVQWETFRGTVDVVHGGPPCQPFSTAGRQNGADDVRDMFPHFVKVVLAVKPRAFVAENVTGLAGKKFAEYLRKTFLDPLGAEYNIKSFRLDASMFGVPQKRSRLFFVGFRDRISASKFREPDPTHHGLTASAPTLFQNANRTMGVREALGLPDLGFDELAPTLRSALTGPRHTTSILSSTAALKVWTKLQIWPNGVAKSREAAQAFPAKDGHYRMSVSDCAVIQGFPPDWHFEGATYQALGLLGNSVAPPMGYSVAVSVAATLR